MKSHPLRISGTCPVCDSILFFDREIVTISLQDQLNLCIDTTTNCSKCSSLLLIENGIIYPFHEKLHDDNPEWPADGKDTDFLTLPQSPPNS